MTRYAGNWLDTYVEYASVTEAPKKMHFWSGISAIAGTLRRRVWIPMKRFTWYPSFYIIFVARPGVVSKTTTADMAMNLLREVPGINFGPDIITWPSLVVKFAESTEMFEYQGDFIPMSAMTLVSGELGNLINPQDREMINLYISLWDGLPRLDKSTKTSGSDCVEAPWINMIGCTTPNWIADNMPVAAIGGGFTSRCIFIYANDKEKLVPYVDEVTTDAADAIIKEALIKDLTYISQNLLGPMTIDEEARVWGREWYEHFWNSTVHTMDTKMMEGYAARKQTHLHKTAMILSVARSDEMVIRLEDLTLAAKMLADLEPDMTLVFAKVGQTEDSIQVDRFVSYIKGKKSCPYMEAYAQIHTYFTDFTHFESIVSGCIRAGILLLENRTTEMWLTYIGKI